MSTKELIKSIKQKRKFVEVLKSVEPEFSIEWVKKNILGI